MIWTLLLKIFLLLFFFLPHVARYLRKFLSCVIRGNIIGCLSKSFIKRVTDSLAFENVNSWYNSSKMFSQLQNAFRFIGVNKNSSYWPAGDDHGTIVKKVGKVTSAETQNPNCSSWSLYYSLICLLLVMQRIVYRCTCYTKEVILIKKAT